MLDGFATATAMSSVSRRWLRSCRNGKRYDSRYIIVFVAPNDQTYDRFGITASRKAAKNAVARNRMKRLLREAIRLAVIMQPKDGIVHYDWVLNARRALLKVNLAVLSGEFQRIVETVGEEQLPTGIEAVEASTPHQLENL